MAKAFWVHTVTGEFGLPVVHKPRKEVRELRRLFSVYASLDKHLDLLKNSIQSILTENGIVVFDGATAFDKNGKSAGCMLSRAKLTGKGVYLESASLIVAVASAVASSPVTKSTAIRGQHVVEGSSYFRQRPNTCIPIGWAYAALLDGFLYGADTVGHHALLI